MKFLLAFLFSVAAVHAGFHHSDEQFEHPRKVVWGTRSVGKAILGKTYHYPHITIKLPNVHDNSLPPGAKWPLNQKNLRGGYGIIKGYSNAGPIVKRPGFMNSISMRGIYPNIHADVLRTTNAVTKSVSKSLPQAVFGKAIKVGRYGIAAHHAPVFHEAPKVLKPTYGEAVHYDLGQGEYGQDTSAHAENYGAPIYRQKESRYAGSADSDFLAVLSSYSNEESSGYRSPQTVIDSGYGSQQGAAYAAPSGQSGYGAPLSHDNSVEQLGGYAAHEQSGFVTDQSGYDAPQGGYDAPQVGYDASQVGYDAPQAGYDAPQAGYDAPQTGYDAPQVGYDAPQAGYDAPQAGYDAPQNPHTVLPNIISVVQALLSNLVQLNQDMKLLNLDTNHLNLDTNHLNLDTNHLNLHTNLLNMMPVNKLSLFPDTMLFKLV
ncbi:unnamed protein product [Cyprideis torosa]|uniref:Uncharacterized protein n=1 Tax=Cyprideis torosa TaxID=163714 RepID=A0A7R8ZMF5_9CRUS|nr:unnamed protein product [Cyprideis torosa]CAG0885696.1 unnamed protein product [Cyprideis torosa]